ncbi:hypothetical protein [Polaromonas sp. JS666]|uniref:hypothetical protein n=1 Tax=Polaromonas sp. (strain JS666 / ATCC BAA-500) TaxID=296591 RepID=UPI00059B9E10|nr:hypothetical protein [Polaromonas sp. JS666]
MIRSSLDKQQLKQWAVVLKQELETHRGHSKDVAELCEYQALMDAIGRARELSIEEPMELTALGYYFFETRLRSFKDLTHALNCFSLLLEGYVLPSSQ